MAIPAATLAVIGTVATVGSAAIGAVSSIAGAASAAEAARQAEEIAQKNKKIAEENAQRSLILAQEEQIDQDMQTAALLGEQESIQAASGLKLSSRSFVLTRAAARRLGRIDALNVREAGRIRAQAYRNEGDAYAAEAAAQRRAGGNAMLQGFLGAGASIIGGAGQLAKAAPNRSGGIMKVPGAAFV